MPQDLVQRWNGGALSRNDLFQEWLEMGEDMNQVLVTHKRRLEMQQRARTV